MQFSCESSILSGTANIAKVELLISLIITAGIKQFLMSNRITFSVFQSDSLWDIWAQFLAKCQKITYYNCINLNDHNLFLKQARTLSMPLTTVFNSLSRSLRHCDKLSCAHYATAPAAHDGFGAVVQAPRQRVNVSLHTGLCL